MTPDALGELIRSRRTVNDFRPEPVVAELLLEAIELARWAPNHKHTEPWRFHLLGPETVAAIVELNTSLVAEKKGAEAAAVKRQRWSAVPGWLLVTSARGDDELRNREDYAATCCAVQNLSLALWNRGVGMKWTTGDVTRHPRFAEIVGLDIDVRDVVGLMWYGYPAKVPVSKRKPVEEIVEERP